MKKKIVYIIALVILLFPFTACAKVADEVKTLHEENGVKIEREGAKTYIHDLKGGKVYSVAIRRARVKKGTAQAVQTASTSIHTETIDIKTVYGFIIVTTADGDILYIK